MSFEMGCPCPECEAARRSQAAASSGAQPRYYGISWNEANQRADEAMRRYSQLCSWRSITDPPKKGPAMSNGDISTPEGVANALHRIAESDATADLSEVREAVSTIEADRTRRIVKDLQGVADLAVLAGSKGRRFVLAYWRDGQVRQVEGVDYAYNEYIAEAEVRKECRVRLNTTAYDLNTSQHTMSTLKETLDERKYPYAIAYFDK